MYQARVQKKQPLILDRLWVGVGVGEKRWGWGWGRRGEIWFLDFV